MNSGISDIFWRGRLIGQRAKARDALAKDENSERVNLEEEDISPQVEFVAAK